MSWLYTSCTPSFCHEQEESGYHAVTTLCPPHWTTETDQKIIHRTPRVVTLGLSRAVGKRAATRDNIVPKLRACCPARQLLSSAGKEAVEHLWPILCFIGSLTVRHFLRIYRASPANRRPRESYKREARSQLAPACSWRIPRELLMARYTHVCTRNCGWFGFVD